MTDTQNTPPLPAADRLWPEASPQGNDHAPGRLGPARVLETENLQEPNAEQPAPNNPTRGADKGSGKAPPERQRIIETVLGAGVRFWRDEDGNGYATVPLDGERLARFRVRSPGFRRFLRWLYGERHPVPVATGTVPGSVSESAVNDALLALEAIAFRDPARHPDVRVVEHAGAVWLDLGAPCWRVVRVADDGWRVVEKADVPLVRPEGLRDLPVPQPGGDPVTVLRALGRLLNLRGEADLRLVVAWLVAALHPAGPYPVLALDGEQGSAKSMSCRLLRRLVDPNKADLRAPPRKEDDLIIAAQSGRVVALENVSSIDADMADALCRLATGAGLSKRRLYTDEDEHIVNVCRPVLLNGIPLLLARADLADRALTVTLPPIPDEQRRPEADMLADFARAAPAILGLLLDGLVTALRRLPTLRLARLPRMADFARLACAAAPAFGWTDEDMLAALR